MFLDIGIGIFTAMLASYAFGADLSFALIAFSILFALLPDADAVFSISRNRNPKYDHEHRDITHRPLVYLPIGTIVVWVLFGKIWGLAFFLASFFHFVHDSIAMGWGVKWLWPFSKNNYAFFYLYSGKLKNGLRKNIFVLNNKNLPSLVEEHGDPEWVRNIYFRWHAIAKVEIIFFLFALSVLLIKIFY